MPTPLKQLPAQQNYAYLQAMGIKLWVPRFELPHAAPSSQCEWQAQAKPTVKEQPVIANASTPVMASGSEAILPTQPPNVSRAADIKADIASPNTPVIANASEAITSTQPPAAEIAPFTLHIWQLANSWQLVFATPPNKQELQLLHNLLFAFHPQTLGITQQTSFNWPLPNLPSDGTKQEAAFSLVTFLTGANFSQLKPEGCMVFGQQLTPLQSLLTKQKADFFYLLPSLEELLNQPQLKAQLWQQATTNGLLANFKGSWVE